MGDLFVQHRGHQIGHRPHPLADLGLAGQPAFQPDIDVQVLVGRDPGLALDEVLPAEGTGFHAGMNLVPRPVQEARVDEGHPPLRRADTFLEVDGGPPFLVHDPQLHRVRGQAQQALYPCHHGIGKGHFLGPVHLGFDHIDRPFDRIPHPFGLLQIMQCDGHRHHRVHQAFGDFGAVGQEDRGVGHQMAHVADPHQRAALQGEGAAVRVKVFAVGVQVAFDRPTGLLESFGQGPFHQAQPVAIGADLVLGIDAGDGILAIHDRGQGAFQLHVGQQGLIPRPDEMRPVKDQFDVQAVVPQEDRIGRLGVAPVAREFRGVHEWQVIDQKLAVFDIVAAHIGMAGACDREGLVQEHPGAGHDPGAPAPIIPARRRGRAHRIGAVKAVIQAAPAGIGGVQRIAGVGDRHHQLRPRHLCDFGIDIRRLDGEGRAFGKKIADLGEEGLVGGMVMRLAAAGEVPGVDLGLKGVTLGQQGAVLRHEIGQKSRETRPEVGGVDASAGQGLILDEAGQYGIHLQSRPFRALGHGMSFQGPFGLIVCVGTQ